MLIQFVYISDKIVVIAKFVIFFVCITKCFVYFIYKPWGESSLLHAKAQSSTTCKQINHFIFHKQSKNLLSAVASDGDRTCLTTREYSYSSDGIVADVITVTGRFQNLILCVSKVTKFQHYKKNFL